MKTSLLDRLGRLGGGRSKREEKSKGKSPSKSPESSTQRSISMAQGTNQVQTTNSGSISLNLAGSTLF